ncbi:hypothetical protein BS47DRAFT_1374526 [Hydnum rufescens UP504]|uniref:Uncharacterized protein n=1 Tax=Hydnum rufescens UP504 TaxID=1448309 RepID=A0A9P6DL04_9AGAM|nr:hypothetical protein BS47DRAFT_1374526 [Hydnum rufescens UP504]
MAKFESVWLGYEGEDLKRHEPNLQPGEKRIIAQFHDESCFHANEFKSSAWWQSILQKKESGSSNTCIRFINEEDGRLIQHNAHGEVIHDARKVIFPGASGDSWWDTQQLLVQVDTAMDIFDATHPDCQALFIFDQSLPTSFDMNKGNGGKQRKQKDTIIPCTNPTISMCGKPQKMTNENGEAKGLQAMLEERGFDMKGMRAKCTPICAMYWGYAKYHYCEVFKATFAEAKQTTIQSLDACPVETIRRFINRSWHFMSAYCLGLTGKAAEWAVRKQKSHRSVVQRAMLAIDSILN